MFDELLNNGCQVSTRLGFYTKDAVDFVWQISTFLYITDWRILLICCLFDNNIIDYHVIIFVGISKDKTFVL